MYSSSLKKLKKTQVIYPTASVYAIERTKALKCVAEYFLLDLAHLTQGLTLLISWCEQKCYILETMLNLDKEFLMKIIYSIDEHTN